MCSETYKIKAYLVLSVAGVYTYTNFTVGKVGSYYFGPLSQFPTKKLPKGQFRPKRDHQISDPVVSVSFWSKPLSWTTCDALGPILAFSSHFMGIFGPRVGF